MVGESGTNPMPQTWKKWLAWTLSPYRVFLFLSHVFALSIVIVWTSIGAWWIGIIYGLVFLWLLERAKE